MSTNNLRVVAAGVAAIVAVLTGVVTGLVGARTATCTPTANPSSSPAPTQKQPGGGIKVGGGAPGRQPDESSGGDCVEDSAFSVPTAAVGFVGAAVAGGVAVALLFAGRRDEPGRGPVAATTPAAGGGPGLAARLDRVEAERTTLIKTCVYVRDRATSKAIADTLGRALSEVGVSTVAPVGVPFDPAHHEAGGATPSPDPARVGTIAAVEVPGYLDRGVVLRAPVVTVYREGAAQ